MPSIELNLRANEGCAPQPTLLWDALWNPATGFADWAYADPSETLNVGGLSARAMHRAAARALEQALCLHEAQHCGIGRSRTQVGLLLGQHG